MDDKVFQFLSTDWFGVAGASADRNKFGNKVVRCYLQVNKNVFPINPEELVIEELSCYKSVLDLPDEVLSLSIVTPPAITEKIIIEAIQKGIKNIWMQPGAESEEAIKICLNNQINLIAGGPCILQTLGFKE